MKINVFFFQAFFIYGALFPGVIKVFLGASLGGILNFSLLALFLFSVVFNRLYVNKHTLVVVFKYLLFFYVVLNLIYLLAYPNQVSFTSFTNVSKVILAASFSFVILYMKDVDKLVRHLIIPVHFFTFNILLFELFGWIDEAQHGVNYLTLTMPVSISVSFLLYKLSFTKNRKFEYLFYITLTLICIYYLLLSGSRSALLIVLFMFFLFFTIKIFKASLFRGALFVLVLVYISWYFFIYFLPTFLETSNYYLYSRLYLDSSSSSTAEELTRSELYSMVLAYIFDGNIFGHGINATRDILNVQYVESYFLEVFLNYGFILGAVLIIFIHYPWLIAMYNIRKRDYSDYFFYLLVLGFCNFMFFIKGWGLYDFSGQLILNALLLSSFNKFKYINKSR